MAVASWKKEKKDKKEKGKRQKRPTSRHTSALHCLAVSDRRWRRGKKWRP
jgi:hypothetical protein